MADVTTFAEANSGREYYVPMSPEQAEEFRARSKALWAEALSRWAADHG